MKQVNGMCSDNEWIGSRMCGTCYCNKHEQQFVPVASSIPFTHSRWLFTEKLVALMFLFFMSIKTGGVQYQSPSTWRCDHPSPLGTHTCRLVGSCSKHHELQEYACCVAIAGPIDKHNPTLHIFPHQRYVGWSGVLNCFMLSSLPCFYAFCWSAIPTSCYIFNVFYSCIVSC